MWINVDCNVEQQYCSSVISSICSFSLARDKFLFDLNFMLFVRIASIPFQATSLHGSVWNAMDYDSFYA